MDPIKTLASSPGSSAERASSVGAFFPTEMQYGASPSSSSSKAETASFDEASLFSYVPNTVRYRQNLSTAFPGAWIRRSEIHSTNC